MGDPKLLVPGTVIEDQAAFAFQADNREVLRVMPDGRFFVRGEEVETNEEVRDIFARWCVFSMGGKP